MEEIIKIIFKECKPLARNKRKENYYFDYQKTFSAIYDHHQTANKETIKDFQKNFSSDDFIDLLKKMIDFLSQRAAAFETLSVLLEDELCEVIQNTLRIKGTYKTKLPRFKPEIVK